jgi:hypothetical protein
MKYPCLPALFCFLVALGLSSLPQSAEARIGERRESLERRLFGSGGIVYREELTQQNRQKGMPYLRYMDYLGGSAEVRVYFKTADGRNPSSSELEEKQMGAGWDLHVVYVNGKSVLEVYQRSHEMSEHEMNHLLLQQGQGSFWKRLGKEEKAEVVSAFGFDMIRDDGNVRAKELRLKNKGRGALLFVDSGIDESLAKLNESDLQKKAPISVDGF